jgi:hypothetical protein
MNPAHELRLRTAFRERAVWTLDELRARLGGVSDWTARRALRELGHRTSYNHNSRYYALLDERAFDRWGLWSHQGVRFSRDGTLTATVRRLVGEAEAGWTLHELEELLRVKLQTVLTTLRRRGEVEREKVGPASVSVAAATGAEQLARRRESHSAQPQRSEVPLEVVVAVLLVLLRHPKSDPQAVVRRLKGHSPPILLRDVEEVFNRYELGPKRGLPSS